MGRLFAPQVTCIPLALSGHVAHLGTRFFGGNLVRFPPNDFVAGRAQLLKSFTLYDLGNHPCHEHPLFKYALLWPDRPGSVEADLKDSGFTDLDYRELSVRWLQYGAFLPMFHSHGTDATREIRRYGDDGNLFYDTIAKFIRLRYRLPVIMPQLQRQSINHDPSDQS